MHFIPKEFLTACLNNNLVTTMNIKKGVFNRTVLIANFLLGLCIAVLMKVHMCGTLVIFAVVFNTVTFV